VWWETKNQRWRRSKSQVYRGKGTNIYQHVGSLQVLIYQPSNNWLTPGCYVRLVTCFVVVLCSVLILLSYFVETFLVLCNNGQWPHRHHFTCNRIKKKKQHLSPVNSWLVAELETNDLLKSTLTDDTQGWHKNLSSLWFQLFRTIRNRCSSANHLQRTLSVIHRLSRNWRRGTHIPRRKTKRWPGRHYRQPPPSLWHNICCSWRRVKGVRRNRLSWGQKKAWTGHRKSGYGLHRWSNYWTGVARLHNASWTS
jgi:hypothetical protein